MSGQRDFGVCSDSGRPNTRDFLAKYPELGTSSGPEAWADEWYADPELQREGRRWKGEEAPSGYRTITEAADLMDVGRSTVYDRL